MLRDYQQKAVSDTWDYMRTQKGNPCIEMPTGSGKSWVIAGLCQDALNYPGTRILMLTHVRELIAQNLEKLVTLWPEAPVGVYAAGLGKKQAGSPITFGSVQTVQRNLDAVGKQDLVIVDECHRINHKNEGGYRKIINALQPYRVIGLTASPYRLGHGYITDGDALFSHIVKPIGIEELVGRGYLAPLRNKVTKHQLDTAGVHKRGGEYIESELQAAVNTDHNNVSAVEEVIARAADRKAWLFFCTGIDHSYAIRDLLRERGITAETITGKTPTDERDDIISRYKAGKITALTNANVLTTGFDYPDIDCLVFLRPTMSAALYVQMAGRGMRPKTTAEDCLVLDFAGLVMQHGPITAVKPHKPGKGKGVPPIKSCENCGLVVPLGTKTCPECGTAFETEQPEKKYQLDETVDIMGKKVIHVITVERWSVSAHVTKSGKPAIKVNYYCGWTKISEYLCINHEGYAGHKAWQTLMEIFESCGAVLPPIFSHGTEEDTPKIAEYIQNNLTPPSKITYVMNGKYENIIKREWNGLQATG